jgi:hypothetical protein
VRNLPILTGLLTVALMGFVGVTMFSAGQPLWGWLLIGLAALRLILLAGHVWRRRREDRDET